MIAGSFGQIVTKTARDHGLTPGEVDARIGLGSTAGAAHVGREINGSVG